MNLKDLEKYGAKQLDSIYNGQWSDNPDICFVFMNPTGRNIVSYKQCKGLKSPRIGAKKYMRFIL